MERREVSKDMKWNDNVNFNWGFKDIKVNWNTRFIKQCFIVNKFHWNDGDDDDIGGGDDDDGDGDDDDDDGDDGDDVDDGGNCCNKMALEVWLKLSRQSNPIQSQVPTLLRNPVPPVIMVGVVVMMMMIIIVITITIIISNIIMVIKVYP